ncbi:KGG domain-containing protein [Deinococcus ficus]|uniref:Stress-induced protein n=1 Tax=Deinococcus ficus TaxID=317577 RepID=A0A221T0F2_9DEIO|nr:KGG domain-containing protein [Deinococcus ficus]ASN82374.1 hypothetical protein DFI_14385 [Deinococcus ficus]
MTNSDRNHTSSKGDGRTQVSTRRRGFAGMDPERQRQIASMGGRAAHESGNAHEFTSEEAREAGRKGGEAVSRNREHMAAIGRRGGEASRSGENGSRREGAGRSQAAAGGQNRGTD